MGLMERKKHSGPLEESARAKINTYQTFLGHP